MDAENLQAFLTRPPSEPEDLRAAIAFVEASSLASGKQMRDFLTQLRWDDRVLLVDTLALETSEALQVPDGTPLRHLARGEVFEVDVTAILAPAEQ